MLHRHRRAALPGSCVTTAGGVSGVLGSPFHLNLLPAWLTNEADPLPDRESDRGADIVTVTQFVPAPLMARGTRRTRLIRFEPDSHRIRLPSVEPHGRATHVDGVVERL